MIRLAVVLAITAAPVHAAEYVAGELYVKYIDSAARTAGGSPEAAITSHGGFDIRQAFPVAGNLAARRGSPEQMARRASLASIRRVRFPEDADMVTIARKLSADPAIEYAEPVWIDHVCREPNDPLYTGQDYLDFIHAPEAWDIATGDSTVVIAIVDNGTDWQHPDLFANVWTNPGEIAGNGFDDDDNGYDDDVHGWDFFGTDATVGDADPSPPSTGNSHGTHVAGIAAAVTDNLTGVASLSDNVRFMPLKTGPGNSDEIYFGFEAILYAADMGADIINCSWGSPHYSATNHAVVETITGEGVLIVAAAGNDGEEDVPFYPAAYGPVLSVGAVTLDGYKSEYSNHGVYVDIAAPGNSILSTIISDVGSGYATLSGTSMAAPLVSALAGLVMSHSPGMDADQVKAQLYGTAHPLSSPEHRLGAGYIDAAGAVGDPARYVEVLAAAFSDSAAGNGDGIFRPGEVLDLTVTVRNIGVAVTGMTLTVDSLNGYLLAETGTVVAGPLAHGGEAVLAGIRLLVNPGAPWDADDIIRFTFTAAGEPAGTGSIMQLVNPSYATFAAGTVALSFSGRGSIGYADFPNNLTGSSFIISRDDVSDQDQNEVDTPLVFEAGFMLGTGPDHVSDVVRGAASETVPDSDFTAASAITYTIDDVEGFDTGTASFTDEAAAGGYGVTVDFTGYSFPDDPVDQCVILSYLVRNTGDANLAGVHAGLFFDFDLPAWDALNDYGYYVGADDIIAVEADATERANKITVGVTALPSIGTPAVIRNGAVVWFGFTEAEKWQALSDPSAWPASVANADVSVVASAPAFDLPPGSAHRVTFIVGYGLGYNDLKAQLAAGRDRAGDIITAVEAPAGSRQPLAFGITGAYPNPFNPSTMIEYASPSGGRGTVTVYAMTGQKIRTLFDGDIDLGAHRVLWDGYDDTGAQVATGVYLVRFSLDGASSVRRVTLVK